MSSGLPSMTALLGLLAVAGYQNRDKITDWLGGIGQQSPAAGSLHPPAAGSLHPPAAGSLTTKDGNRSGGLTGVLEQLRSNLGGATSGGILGGGLAELIDRFKQNGHGEAAESWVGTGPNKPLTASQLEQAIGPDVLDALSRQTGLPRQELLERLSRELPNAVDRYTPDGRLPSERVS